MARSCFHPFLLLSFNFMLFFCNGLPPLTLNNTISKTALVEGIIEKIFHIKLSSFSNLPIDKKADMLVQIEDKLTKSAQFLGPKGGKYVALLMEAIKYSTSNDDWSSNFDYVPTDLGEKHDRSIGKQNTNTQESNVQPVESTIINKKHKIKRNKKEKANKVESDEQNSPRRMEFEFIDNFNINKAAEDRNDENDRLIINTAKMESNTRNRHDLEPYFKNVTIESPCQHEKKNMCRIIKALRTIKCNNEEISILKLCDGIKDCFDYSDELDCSIQGIDKAQNANQIMMDINNSLSKKCYVAKVGNPLILKQNKILQNVLETQVKFIEKHPAVTVASKYSNMRKFYFEPEVLKKVVNEVAVVVETLSLALDTTICSSIDENSRKFNDIDDIHADFMDKLNNSLVYSTWSPKYCSCKKEHCTGKCSVDCELVCLQRNNLGRWQCLAVSNQNSISLNLLCDGKLDCYDESDESGCSTDSGFAKFEANNLYRVILDMISTKLKSEYNKSHGSRLRYLQKIIEKLQRLTTKRKVDVLDVKALREECFTQITVIYDQIRSYSTSMVEMHDTYAFLHALSSKIISAMKRSHMGNDKIIASNGCFCRDNKCALINCPELCTRACAAEHKITRYYCGRNVTMNLAVPLEAICNGEIDCPGKDDEEDCSKDICRKHHLIVLRHNIEDAADAAENSVGEALKAWNIKVSATLQVLVSNDRPTPQILRNAVKTILQDLLMAYAGVVSKRRSDADVIKQFVKVAHIVMKSLKSCSK